MKINALPMYLGLDLRGGVHFLLQVDMHSAIEKRAESTAADLRTQFRDKRIRHAGISRQGNTVVIAFNDEQERARANDLLRSTQPDLVVTEGNRAGKFILSAELSQKAIQNVQEYALKQNISTLHNRINELGVAEPVIAQQVLTASWCSCPVFRIRPRLRTFWPYRNPGSAHGRRFARSVDADGSGECPLRR